jgi:hypothetical protein
MIIPSTPTGLAAGHIIVLARAPLPGRAKTRLIPALGAQGAARMHALLLRRTLATVSEAAGGSATLPVTLRVAPAVGHPLFAQLQRRYGVQLRAQGGGDLGRRMQQALAAALRDSEAAVLVGSDCPGLAAGDIRSALQALQGGMDAVLGPALDGGYWLIGLRRPSAAVFQGVDWGGARVAAQTRQRLRRLGWRWLELTPRGDLDLPADVRGSGVALWRGR